MNALYSENNKEKAAWLRELIQQGHIAPGVVDERDIQLIEPDELAGFTQCHFFAGIGVWSYALRLAGWPDDWPVWTGSCPCPSFSAAGKGEGFDDPRHLWPAWARLIGQRRPPVVFGEQADDAIGYGWLDLVQTDLEAQTYAVAKAVLGAGSVGGSDIRQRLYFVADAAGARRLFGAHGGIHRGEEGAGARHGEPERSRDAGRLGDAEERGLTVRGSTSGSTGRPAQPDSSGGLADAEHGRSEEGHLDKGSAAGGNRKWADTSDDKSEIAFVSGNGGLANADGRNPGAEGIQRGGQHGLFAQDGGTCRLGDSHGEFERGKYRVEGASESGIEGEVGIEDGERYGFVHDRAGATLSDWPSPLNGPWRDADWLLCRDGKWRPVEPGTFPLAHGSPFRVGRLRGYGDAINSEVAKAFIASYMEATA